jgi:hypothetical protein
MTRSGLSLGQSRLAADDKEQTKAMTLGARKLGNNVQSRNSFKAGIRGPMAGETSPVAHRGLLSTQFDSIF